MWIRPGTAGNLHVTAPRSRRLLGPVPDVVRVAVPRRRLERRAARPVGQVRVHARCRAPAGCRGARPHGPRAARGPFPAAFRRHAARARGDQVRRRSLRRALHVGVEVTLASSDGGSGVGEILYSLTGGEPSIRLDTGPFLAYLTRARYRLGRPIGSATPARSPRGRSTSTSPATRPRRPLPSCASRRSKGPTSATAPCISRPARPRASSWSRPPRTPSPGSLPSRIPRSPAGREAEPSTSAPRHPKSPAHTPCAQRTTPEERARRPSACCVSPPRVLDRVQLAVERRFGPTPGVLTLRVRTVRHQPQSAERR